MILTLINTFYFRLTLKVQMSGLGFSCGEGAQEAKAIGVKEHGSWRGLNPRVPYIGGEFA